MAYAWAGQIQNLVVDSDGSTRVVFDDSAPVEGLIAPGAEGEPEETFTFSVGDFITLLGDDLVVRKSDGRVILRATYWVQNP